MNHISCERLRELFHYDPETGFMTRKVATRKSKIGSRIGCANDEGRIVCDIDGKMYKLHRLAWLHFYGEIPELDIDHINGEPSDNRIANLRQATCSQNLGNSRKPTTNKSGKKGVSWHSVGKKWQAHIKVGGTNFYLGLFDTVEDAHAAYMRKAVEMRGEFARAE